MVVVKLKPLEEILKHLSREKLIGIIGCELGSGRCKNGGLKEAKNLAQLLAVEGFKVSIVSSPGGTCILERIKLTHLKKVEEKCELVVSLACGAGTQVLAENLEIPVITGVDTLFIGADFGKEFKEYCIACGECIISETGGICPVARCPKSLLNGPCGGAINGKCEVDPSIPCIWYEIETKTGKLDYNFPPFDYSKFIHPRELKLKE